MRQTSQAEIPIMEDLVPILLVEDNPTNRKVALILLKHLAFDAKIAINGKEAVEAVQQEKFSVILMDCHMPEMDGFEATVAIRKLEAQQGTYTPIIAVTALAMAGDRERCIAAGMDDYLSKPIDSQLLKLKLDHWIHKKLLIATSKNHRKLRAYSDIRLLDKAPIDIEELKQFYGNKQFAKVLLLFFADMKDMTRQLKWRIHEENAIATIILAQQIEKSCASIGAKQPAQLCLYLIQAVERHDWLEADKSLTSLLESLEYIKSFVSPLI